MAVERKIDNTYHIFKLMADELNWKYVAEGPVLPNRDVHGPQGGKNLQDFTDGIINDHMEYLEKLGYTPRNPSCSHICFSYEPPYESAIRHSEIWHTKKLSPEEITLFEKSAVSSHQKFWNRK